VEVIAVAEEREGLWQIITRVLIPVGLLIAGSGFIVGTVMDEWGLLPKGLIIGGLVVMVACIAINFNWIMSEISKRRTLIGINVMIMIALALFVLVAVSMINVRHYRRIDMTKKKRFGLSSQTLSVLKGLKEPVRIITLYDPKNGWLYEVKDLLEEYDYNSDKVKIEHINPFLEKARTQQLLKELKLDSIEVNSVVVAYGDRSKVIKNADMIEESFRTPYNPYSEEPPKFRGEEEITAAIISVTEEKPTKIYFTTGHKERDPEDYDQNRGYSEVRTLLKRENYEIEKIDLKKQEIPEDCGVLVIAGPRSPFTEDEIDALRDYLADEGRLMVLLEPLYIAKRSSGLEDFLREYGADVDPSVLVMNKVFILPLGVRVTPEIYLSGGDEYPYHKITEKMRNERTVFLGACPVEAKEPDETLGLTSKTIIKTSDASWGETDFSNMKNPRYDSGTDKAGPLSIAVAVEPKAPEQPSPYGGPPMPAPDAEKPKGPRLVVVGCVEFASNSYSGWPGNQDFFMNCIGWLAAKETKLGIRAKELDIRRVTLTPTASKAIFVISIIALPLLGVLLGVGIWVIRRH